MSNERLGHKSARTLEFHQKLDEEAALRALFSYHAPNEAAVENMQEIRAQAERLAGIILRHCPPSADRTAAIRKVREAVMTANAAIVLEGRNLP